MRTSYCFVFILLIIISIESIGQGIIIDHTCNDISSLPEDIIEDIKQNGKLQGVGTSHAHQLLTGLNLLEQENLNFPVCIGNDLNSPNPNWGNASWLPDTDEFDVMDGSMPYFTDACGKCCNYYGAQYWEDPDSYDNLLKTLNCWPTINVAWWGWCQELDTYTSSQLQDYFNKIEDFEVTFPDVQFVYSTGTTEATGSQGHNRWLRNNEIREYCLINNKVLFDNADLECWSDGDFNYYIHNGDTVPIRHSHYSDQGVHHTNNLNCKNKGKALWYMMAILRGWEPNTASIDSKTYKENVSNELSIFPNPSSTNITIEVDNLSKEFVHISIMNFSGKTILSKKTSVNRGELTEEINIGELSKGAYVVKIYGENFILYDKFVKK